MAMNINEVTYKVGIPDSYRNTAVELYDVAFGEKIALGVPEKGKRLALLNNCMLLEYAIGAFYKEDLVGIAGFYAQNGHLTGGKVRLTGMITLLGLWGGVKASIILSIFNRKPKGNELLMDGISVSPSGRGKGIGGKLLAEVKNYATKNNFDSVRLDVIDTNPKARKLYERMGFVVTDTNRFPYLKKYLGFSGVDTMTYEI